MKWISFVSAEWDGKGNGTQPMPLERMLRIHFMQHWFNLSDPVLVR